MSAHLKPCPLGQGRKARPLICRGADQNVRIWGAANHPRGPRCGGPNTMMQGSRKPPALAVGSLTSTVSCVGAVGGAPEGT